MMARFGVEVVILEGSARLIPDHEPEIGRAVQDYFEEDGIGVITGVQVERLSREGETRVVHARVMGQQREYRADQILMAVWRQPNNAKMGAEERGGKQDHGGAIIVDPFQQTKNTTNSSTSQVTTNPPIVY